MTTLTHLGHAMWLAELGQLRILFDPLLSGAHHGRVFEVFPRRDLEVESLTPDFVVVTHRHPDHFDVKSLRRLAQLDADSVLFTSDQLVADTARELGFRNVNILGTWDKVTLEEGALFTTASQGIDIEWGMMLCRDGVTVWNQVDSVLRNPDDARDVLARARVAFGLPEDQRLDLMLARWQPLLEVNAVLGERTGFPTTGYATLLDEIAACDAKALVPGSAGSRHREPQAFMNQLVYPQTEARFLADVALRAPGTRTFPAEMGGVFQVDRDGTTLAPEPSTLCRVHAGNDDRVFRPYELPALVDPFLSAKDEAPLAERLERWLRSELAPALAREFPKFGAKRPLSLVVELAFSKERRAYTLQVGERGTTVEPGFDRDYDAVNAILASELGAVLDGTQHWGEPLLGGWLRASSRAYDVDAHGTRKLRLAPIFFYYALSYEESVKRTTRWLMDHPSEAPL
jgi:hypothetical protein